MSRTSKLLRKERERAAGKSGTFPSTSAVAPAGYSRTRRLLEKQGIKPVKDKMPSPAFTAEASPTVKKAGRTVSMLEGKYDQAKSEYRKTQVGQQPYAMGRDSFTPSSPYAAGLQAKQAAEEKASPVGQARAKMSNASDKLTEAKKNLFDAKQQTTAENYEKYATSADAAKGMEISAQLGLNMSSDAHAAAIRVLALQVGEPGRYAFPQLEYLTEKQKETLLSLAGREDWDGAGKYWKAIERSLNAQNQAVQSQETRDFAEEHPIAGGVVNVGAGFTQPFAYAANTFQTAKNAITGEYEPTDFNSAWFAGAHVAKDTAEGVHAAAEKAGGGVGAFAADTTLSIANMGAKLFTGPASLPLMGLSAAGDNALGALERGATPGQAFLTSTAAGAAEILTEKLPVDELFKMAKVAPKSAKEVIKNILKTMGSEGVQEIVTEISNNLVDQMVMGDQSQYELYVRELMDRGIDEDSARGAATRQFYLENVVMAGLGGAVAGGVLGGIGQGIGYARNQGRQKAIANTMLNVDEGTVSRLTQAAKEMYGADQAQKTAAQTDGGGRFSLKGYEGVDLSKDGSVYTYDFLTSLPDMSVTVLPDVSVVRDINGQVDARTVVDLGMKNARAVGTEKDGKVFVRSSYTGKQLQITGESIRHGLNGGLNRLLTNARLCAVIGDVVKNAVPINALTNKAEGVSGTYAMAGYATDSVGREFVAILTVEQRSGRVVNLETYDMIHAVSGRQKNSSQASTKLQGLYPIKAAKISIADFLEVVKSTHQSILSEGVLGHFGETRNPNGQYTGQTLFSIKTGEDALSQTALKMGAEGRKRGQEGNAKAIQRAAHSFGEQGSQMLQEMYWNDVQDPEKYFGGFAVYYHAGLTGQDIMSVREDYDDVIKPVQAWAAYRAGQVDAAASLAAEIKAAGYAPVAGTDAGLVGDEYVASHLDSKTYRQLNSVLKLLGLRGRFVDEFIERHRENRSLLQWLKDGFHYLVGKLTGKEKAQAQTAKGKLAAALDAAAEQAKTLTKESGGRNTGLQTDEAGRYEIKYDQENHPFVVVKSDILAGVPKSQWVKIVKNDLQTRFPAGVVIGNDVIKINAQTTSEFTSSDYSKWLRDFLPKTYEDKFRAADSVDEILLASRDYVGEGLKHPRKDNIKEFARGTVKLRIGKNDYIADVIVATTKGGSMVLYDLVNIQPTKINERKQT